MNSIYRCRAKVAFKPARNDNVIVFPERQIDSVSVKLKQNVSGFNQSTSGGVDNYLYGMEGNECSVTINDPYLDGLAWPALGNIGQVIGGFNAYQNAGNLLPKCEKGQDPDRTPCYPFYDTIDNEDIIASGEDRGWLIISLYYEIEGIGITSEFQSYFKVSKITIDHGSKYPQVTLRGEIAFNTEFNQTIPVFLEKDKPVIKQLNDKIFSKSGYKLESVCGEDEDTVSDRSYKSTALSPTQLLKKYAEDKDFLEVYVSPKAKDANIIQICNKTDYSCPTSKVFYLGKGLYKQYTINAEYQLNALDRQKSRRKPGVESTDPNALPGLKKVGEGKFRISLLQNETTKKKIEIINNASSSAFTFSEKQFEEIKDYITTEQGGKVFRGKVNGSKFEVSVLKDKHTPFANAVVGRAYLGGTVTTVNNNRITIQSPFAIHLGDDNIPAKNSLEGFYVHQEYTSLAGINVKEGDKVEIGQIIGSVQTGDKQTKTRYYIKPPESESSIITIGAADLEKCISTTEDLTDKEKQEENANSSDGSNPDGDIIGWVGYSGESRPPGPEGAHLHMEIRASGGGSGTTQPVVASDFDPYITVGGKKPSQWTTTSEHGSRNPARPNHTGVDIADNDILGQPIRLINGKFTETGTAGGYGAFAAADIGGGKEIFLAHLLTNPEERKAGSDLIDSSANGVKSGGITSGGVPVFDKDCFKLKTEFQGVPRSLEIEPGKTVLSFITNYDAWIEGNKDDTQIEPDVWIPERYKNWFINETEWKWERGNLKVIVQAFRRPLRDVNLSWEEDIPTFSEYLEDYEYNSYYDYIRSPSNLCYKRKTDKEISCNKCGKPSNRTGKIGSSSSSASDVKSEFPSGKFKYTCNNRNQSTVQAILDAGSALGVTNKMGLAAIVGNAIQESRLNPTAKNTTGANEFGLFQWNPAPGAQRFQLLEKYVADNGGDINSVGTQLNFFVWEVNNYSSLYGNLVSELNNASSAEDAAIDFERIYEKSSDTPGSTGYNNRINYTQEIFDCLTEQ